MNAFNIVRFIIHHPLNKNRKLQAALRFVKWQLVSKIFPYSFVYNFTDKAKLIIAKGMTGATGNFYCGLHEFYDMSFLLHFLRKQDVFVDIGANIGSYTILASAHIGAKSVAFEPHPVVYNHLENNIHINKIQSLVIAYNRALGAENTVLKFTQNLDTQNHIITDNSNNGIDVSVSVLDDILNENTIPTLIKIDVEGFETRVLQGAQHTIQNNQLKCIIIELNGSGKKYGFNEEAIHLNLLKLGFKPYTYNPFERLLKEVRQYGNHNTIYIRDLPFVMKRITEAEKISVNQVEF